MHWSLYFKQNSVRFFLWTRGNAGTEDADVIAFPKISSGLRNSHFRPDRPVKVLIHGFADDGKTAWVTRAKGKYLTEADCNVISVDWKDLVMLRKLQVHAVWFIRDTVKWRLVLSLKIMEILTSSVPYFVSYFLAIHRLSLHIYQE